MNLYFQVFLHLNLDTALPLSSIGGLFPEIDPLLPFSASLSGAGSEASAACAPRVSVVRPRCLSSVSWEVFNSIIVKSWFYTAESALQINIYFCRWFSGDSSHGACGHNKAWNRRAGIKVCIPSLLFFNLFSSHLNSRRRIVPINV